MNFLVKKKAEFGRFLRRADDFGQLAENRLLKRPQGVRPLFAKKRSFRSLGAAVFELLAISSKNLTSKFRLTSDPFFGHFRSENQKNKDNLF